MAIYKSLIRLHVILEWFYEETQITSFFSGVSLDATYPSRNVTSLQTLFPVSYCIPIFSVKVNNCKDDSLHYLLLMYSTDILLAIIIIM